MTLPNTPATPPPTGFNRIPRQLREVMPDWLAGTVVVVVTGLALALLVFILGTVFPVK
jgi:hypothetical protein